MSFSCDPNELISNARCILQCIPPGLQTAAQTALLDLINGGPTPVNLLMANGKEYIWRVPPRMQTALHIYLLLVILEGTGRTVNELLQSASCMRCIPAGAHPPVQTYEICEWNEGGQGICDHPIVLDWLERLANDFQPRPSDATIQAVCDFCDALDIYGITDKMLVVNPIIPDSFLAMRYPLIYQVGNGASPFINHNFLAADLNPNGLLGDGTKWFQTGFVPSNQWGIVTDSSGISIYETDASIQAVNPEAECAVETVANGSFFASVYEPTLAVGIYYCWNNPSQTVGALVDTPAFYCLSRTSNTSLRLYQANSGIPFNQLGLNAANQTGLPIPNLEVYFMGNNAAGVSGYMTYKRVSFMAIHEGLTAAESEDLYWATLFLRMDLGGGWI